MDSLRLVGKRGTELLLCRTGLAGVTRRLLGGRVLILAYHNVVPHGEPVRGDASLHLPQKSFAHQLDLLRRTHEVVPLSAVLETQPRMSRPRAVITLDDATSGALSAGLEELVSRRLTATFFVAPSFVPGRSFWWDALEGVSDEYREHALVDLRGADAEIREWAQHHGVANREVPAHQRCGSEAQLVAAAREGMTFGAHTWSHRNLAALSRAELEDELVRPLTWLRARLPAVLPWLAYPYGRYSSQAALAAEEFGYEGALRVEGGWLGKQTARGQERYRLPRLNVPAGLTPDGFTLRTSGVFR